MRPWILLLMFLTASLLAFSQKEPPPPYKKTLKIPAFKVYLASDSSLFTEKNLAKGKTTIFIYYGADCGHCSVFAKQLMDSISLFQNTQILMVTHSEIARIQKFDEETGVSSSPLITLARDLDFFFITHYGVRQFPSAYVYNAQGRFVRSFKNDIPIRKLAAVK